MAVVVWSLAVIEITRSCLLLAPATVAYSVVADVEGYPEFLPACESVTVLTRDQNACGVECVEARVVASKAGASFDLVTRNIGVLNESIGVSLVKGPFDILEGKWCFKALGEAGCRVDFSVTFVANGLLSRLINPIAQSVADLLVDAFSHHITQTAALGEML